MRIGCAWADAARPSTGRVARAAEYLSSDRLDVVIVFLPVAPALMAVCCAHSVRQEMASVNSCRANRQAGLAAAILGAWEQARRRARHGGTAPRHHHERRHRADGD